jgi:hypothetical protein
LTEKMLPMFTETEFPAALKPQIDAVHENFLALANWLSIQCPQNAGRTLALTKLLEAREAAMRSIIFPGI